MRVLLNTLRTGVRLTVEALAVIVLALVLTASVRRVAAQAPLPSSGGAFLPTANQVVSGMWWFTSPGGIILSPTGAANGSFEQMKVYRVDGVADNVATNIFTINVPNSVQGASIPVILTTGIGAGGAVGDWECTGTAYGQVVLERVAGAAAVANTTTLSNTGSACSSGATTITTSYAVSSVSGANTAAQTFTVQVTVAKGGGSSTNHHVIAEVDLINANQAGISVS